ncbi:MAG: acyl-CoA dehydrogenase family protein [Candidatus Binatia bacterium]
MDFRYTPEEQAFHMEVRRFVTENLAEELKIHPEVPEELVPLENAFLKKMAERGWIGLAFPKEYGGRGENPVPMNEYILLDELHHQNAPGPALTFTYLVGVVGNTLLRQASEELKREFLPKVVKADIRFSISYSEPDAGNDIAAVQTRAVEDGDCFVVNGTKRFITCADVSDYMWTLVRTEPQLPKHKGLSILMIDNRLAGITILPMVMMNGLKTCEVILDDVRVPKRYLVGERGKGWDYLMEALARERSTMINFRYVSEPFERFVQWVRTAEFDGDRPTDDPAVRQALAHMKIQIEAGKMLQLVAGSRAADKDYVPTLEASASKMWAALMSWEKADLALDVMRAHGFLTKDCEDRLLDGWWAAEYGWAGHAWSGAGGVDLNRKIIAQQGLGLPRG